MRIHFLLAFTFGFIIVLVESNFDKSLYRRHSHTMQQTRNFNTNSRSAVGGGGGSGGVNSNGVGVGVSSVEHRMQQRASCGSSSGCNRGSSSCGSGSSSCGSISSSCGSSGGGCNRGSVNCNQLINMQGSPKEKATNIAQKAAVDAKAANDAQNDAACIAAQQVKTQLAEKAAQAAKAAEAAMAGKQQMVEQLQCEIKEAEALRQQEEQAVQNAQNACSHAQMATAAANEQLCAINIVADNAKQNLQAWEMVSANAQQELAEKTQHHEMAKMRIEQLLRNLGCAREDLERTKQAACKAAGAARKAAENAESRSPRNFDKRQAWRHRNNNNRVSANIASESSSGIVGNGDMNSRGNSRINSGMNARMNADMNGGMDNGIKGEFDGLQAGSQTPMQARPMRRMRMRRHRRPRPQPQYLDEPKSQESYSKLLSDGRQFQ